MNQMYLPSQKRESAYSLLIANLENYLKRIFYLEDLLRDKDHQNEMLKFELKLKENLIDSLKKYFHGAQP